jgi:predicted transcriptional regulator
VTRLFIHVGADEAAAERRVTETVRRLERDAKVAPEEHITFETWTEFFRILSPNRIALLEQVLTDQPRSIMALAEALGRDYRNVHDDVTALRAAGLLSVTPGGITTDTAWQDVTIAA